MTGLLASVAGPRPRPVLIMTAVLAAADILGAGAAFGDLIGVKALALFVLATKAISVGMSVLVQGQVTPLASPQTFDGTPLVPAGAGAAGATVVVNGAADPAETARVVAARLRDETGSATTRTASTAFLIALALVFGVLLLVAGLR